MAYLTKATKTLCIGLFFTLAASSGAWAIQCNEDAQILPNGDHIVTPYCQDSNLASVAREFGFKVTARTIRTDPNKKEEVCLVVAHDSRVSDVCSTFLGDNPFHKYSN